MRRSLIAVLAGICLLVCGPAEARPKPHRHHPPTTHQDAPVQAPTPYAGPPVEDAHMACDEESGCHWKEGAPPAADVAPRLADAAIQAPREIAQSIGRAGGYAIVKTREGAGRVVAWAGERFQGLIHDLQDAGYKVGGPGCLSSGHMRHSKHHWGGACDFFGQYARDRTRLRQPPPQMQIALARKHGLISGCMWRNRDCGHFEVPIPGQSVTQYMAARGYARRKRYASR